MILSDKQIKERMEKGDIIIKPFNEENLGSNSYDVTLGNKLYVYDVMVDSVKCHDIIDEGMSSYIEYLDINIDNAVIPIEIPKEGYILKPGCLYLGVTNEYTETKNLVPFLEGKSSLARLGISIHETAGKGDNGYKGYWTLEISCIHPVKIYRNTVIGQMIYFETGDCDIMYDKKKSAKYNNNEKNPIPSRYYLNR